MNNTVDSELKKELSIKWNISERAIDLIAQAGFKLDIEIEPSFDGTRIHRTYHIYVETFRSTGITGTTTQGKLVCTNEVLNLIRLMDK